MKLLLLILVAALGLGFYIRRAPSDPQRWHIDLTREVPDPGQGGVLLKGPTSPVFDETPEALLTRLDQIIRATPRTERLAGSLEDGHITYVTRSALWGFPDYTTVSTESTDQGTALLVLARLRFGRSDLGVNTARVQGWLAQLSAQKGV